MISRVFPSIKVLITNRVLVIACFVVDLLSFHVLFLLLLGNVLIKSSFSGYLGTFPLRF